MKKKFIIKKSDEIEAIIKNKLVEAGQHFIVYRRENHDAGITRFALSVPKKYGNAASRNQMKRRLRYVFDQTNIKKGYDVFIIAKTNSSTLNFNQISCELNQIFTKSGLVEGNNV